MAHAALFFFQPPAPVSFEAVTHLKPFAALVLILAATLEMRGPITAVGPLAGRLTSELGLSASEYGLAAALPIAAFGLFSFAAPAAARRFGLYGAVIVLLAMLAAGGLVRSAPNYPVLLLGTLLIGAGIAALNVLMPVVVKSQDEAKTGTLLGLYTGVVGLSGAIGALSSHPLAALTNFTQAAFLAWAAYGALIFALWLAAFGGSRGPSATLLRAPSLRRHPGAWAVTAVMGLQSLLIYTVAAWLPPYLETKGVSADTAGAALALFLVSGLPASILTDRFMRRCGPEWASEALMSLSYLAGLWLWTLGDPWIFLGSILAGAPPGLDALRRLHPDGPQNAFRRPHARPFGAQPGRGLSGRGLRAPRLRGASSGRMGRFARLRRLHHRPLGARRPRRLAL